MFLNNYVLKITSDIFISDRKESNYEYCCISKL